MINVYLIGNGYVCNYITSLGSTKYKYIGVCRSQKNNCHKKYPSRHIKRYNKLQELINEDSYVVYLAPPQQNGDSDLVIKNFFKAYTKKGMY